MKFKKKSIGHCEDPHFEKDVKKLLLFRKIVKAEQLTDQIAELTLDNGVQLIVEGNDGCGGCGNGWFYIDELNECDNAITNVETVFETDETSDEMIFKLFVFAEDKKINVVQYSGYDNGYYGTGYRLYVKIKE